MMEDNIKKEDSILPENSDKDTSKVKKETKFSRKSVSTLLLGIIVVLGSLAGLLYFKINPIKVFQKADYLSVVSVSPMGTVQNPNPRISVKFNLPVTAHHVTDYVLISPYIKGKIVNGETPEEIVFVPEEKFAPGSMVTLLLKPGLPSDSGKKLMDQHSSTFQIAFDAKTIAFTNNDLSGKFMSFEASRGTDITLKVGEGVRNPSIRIYKANSDALIESLSYNSETRVYSEKPVDTKSFTLLQDVKDVKNDQKINFKNEVGLYFFEGLEEGTPTNSAWIALNEIAIHLRQDDQKVYLAAQSLDTNQPEGGINLTFYELSNQAKTIGQHTLAGIQEYPLRFPQKLDLVLAKKGSETMVIPVSIPNAQAEIGTYTDLEKKLVTFLYTDRPIYKKGDKVSFRGIVRQDNDGLYSVPSVDKVKVYRYIGKNNTKIDQIVDIKQGGIFSGEFTISQEDNEGYNGLYVTSATSENDPNVNGYAYFDVFEYKKPPFGLETNVEKSEYTRGDNVKATFSGKYFDGNVMSNQKVKYSVYSKDFYETEKVAYNSSFKLNGWGGMCGGGGFDEYYGQEVDPGKEITLDSQGNASIDFSTKNLNSVLSQEVTFLVEKMDDNGNKILSAKSAIVHQGEFNIFFRPGPTRSRYDEEFVTVFYAEDNLGNKIANRDFKYEVYQETWASGSTKPTKKVLKSGNVKTDDSGTASFKEKVGAQGDPNSLVISVSGEDSRQNKIETRRNIWFYKDKSPRLWMGGLDQTVLKIVSLKSSLVPGENAKMEIIAPQDMIAFITFERGRVYNPQWLNLKKGSNTFEFSVAANYMPSISPTISFFYNGQYFIEGLSLNVPALQKLVNIEISQDKDKYNPGDTAIITIKTKDSSGNLISADLGVAIVDKAIFALRKNAAPPLHSSFYFFRGRSVNTSSSLSWIASFEWGGGGGGGGDGSPFKKDIDTLYWNPLLKTGSDGEVKIEVPVGETVTTWKVLTYASTEDTKVGQGDSDFLVAE